MKVNLLIIVLFSSLISLIGTMTGASLGVLIKKPSSQLLSKLIGFAAGLMLSVVVFNLIPEAMLNLNFIGVIVILFLGSIFIFLLDNKLNFNDSGSDKYLKVALMTATGLMLHNFPEGIVMGCGFLQGGALGIKMSVIIAIHDIPEGIAVAAPLMASKVKPLKIMLYAFITALPTALGTVIGISIGEISPNVLGSCLAFAAGIMLYVVCGEMIPEASKLSIKGNNVIYIILGILVGLIFTKVL